MLWRCKAEFRGMESAAEVRWVPRRSRVFGGCCRGVQGDGEGVMEGGAEVWRVLPRFGGCSSVGRVLWRCERCWRGVCRCGGRCGSGRLRREAQEKILH